MPLIGSGFLAHHFESLAATHPNVLFLAAGVSDSSCTDLAEFAREKRVVEDAIGHCHNSGWLLIYFSSAGCTPGDYVHDVTEDTPPRPTSPYGRHKLAMEYLIRNCSTRHLILRLSNLVGENQNARQLVPSLAGQIRSGIVEIWRDARRDLVDVHDVAALTERLLRRDLKDGIINVASGFSVPIEDLVDYLCFRLETSVRKHYVCRPDTYTVCTARLRSIVGDLTEFGFHPLYYRRVIDKYYLGVRDHGKLEHRLNTVPFAR